MCAVGHERLCPSRNSASILSVCTRACIRHVVGQQCGQHTFSVIFFNTPLALSVAHLVSTDEQQRIASIFQTTDTIHAHANGGLSRLAREHNRDARRALRISQQHSNGPWVVSDRVPLVYLAQIFRWRTVLSSGFPFWKWAIVEGGRWHSTV
jgi:hypothetical protein